LRRPDETAPRVQRMSIVAIALLGILLLLALIAFGLGQARWSWASVAASFLVVLTLGGYLYLAARLLHHEWKWSQSVRAKTLRLHELEYAREAGPEGELAAMSLTTLTQVRDRWQRALDSVDTWRGRRWEHASFSPPEGDDQEGTLNLPPPAREPVPEGETAPPEGTAAAAAGNPLDPGMILYLFDEASFNDGGRYLGAFIVAAIDQDPEGGHSVTVRQTAPRDHYDSEAWAHASGDVVVFDQLPTDRWSAFTTTPTERREPVEADDGPATPAADIAPTPVRPTPATIEELVAEQFRDGVQRHSLTAAETPGQIEPAEWPGLRDSIEEGRVLPGEYWAQAEFTDSVDRDTFLGLESPSADGDLKVEMELTAAFELEAEGKAKIRKVFYRRPLLDAETLVHGSIMPDGEILADGLAGMMRSLKRDIAALEASNQQLEASLASATQEQHLLGKQADEISADLVNWARDVAAATRTTEAFAAATEAAAKRLADTEREVAELGRALDAEVGQAVEEIDLVAPPPAGRAAGSPAAAL
jgi:hypothetical protein